jgi:hypothetical protein
MKFEIVDTVKDDYIIVEYKSGVIPDLSVFIKISFALGIIEKMLDYGYGEYETHTSEEVEAYFADDFDIHEVIENEEEVDLSDYEKDLIYIIFTVIFFNLAVKKNA